MMVPPVPTPELAMTEPLMKTLPEDDDTEISPAPPAGSDVSMVPIILISPGPASPAFRSTTEPFPLLRSAVSRTVRFRPADRRTSPLGLPAAEMLSIPEAPPTVRFALADDTDISTTPPDPPPVELALIASGPPVP